LATLLPEYANLKDVLRVIDVRHSAHGRVLRVLMNADSDEAVGFLVNPVTLTVPSSSKHH
jgi:hypothetical protein